MGKADPRIERYLSKDRAWRDELVALRQIWLSQDVTEALKWRKPCYSAHGGNLGMIAGTRDHALLSFFKGVLIDDPKRLLTLPGPNSRSGRVMRFESVASIDTAAADIRGFVGQAIAIEKAGRTVVLPKDDLVLPPALIAAFASDPDLETAFRNLTPGRQRGYVIHIDDAKQETTRRARIDKWRMAILAGKGMHDR